MFLGVDSEDSDQTWQVQTESLLGPQVILSVLSGSGSIIKIFYQGN